MIKYAIVDDEPIAHRIIEGFAEKIDTLQKVSNCYDAFEAISLMQANKVDLLFLDINMPKLTGFEFLSTLEHPPKVIITSAHKEFALEGYEFDVVDYLLKPFSLERFIRAVNKVLFIGQPKTEIGSFEDTSYIFIKAEKKQHRILLDDILYIEASRNYSNIFLKAHTIRTLKKISEFEELLPNTFIRVHNSFIVAKNKVQVIDGNRIHIDSHTIPIGQTYRSIIAKIYK